VKGASQGSKLNRAEPMLRANSSSVLRSNLRWAGVSDRPLNILPLTFCATAGANKRNTRQHSPAVCVSTLAGNQLKG
jgi:hypothetical protein